MLLLCNNSRACCVPHRALSPAFAHSSSSCVWLVSLKTAAPVPWKPKQRRRWHRCCGWMACPRWCGSDCLPLSVPDGLVAWCLSCCEQSLSELLGEHGFPGEWACPSGSLQGGAAPGCCGPHSKCSLSVLSASFQRSHVHHLHPSLWLETSD